MQLKVKKLYDDSKSLTQANPSDAGYDLYAHSIKIVGEYRYDPVNIGTKLYSSAPYIQYGTGISIQPDNGYFTYLAPRSSIRKCKLNQCNSVGVLDRGYTGEILACFHYIFDPEDLVIFDGKIYGKIDPKKIYSVGDAIGQLIVTNQLSVSILEVNSLDSTDRGDKGHGSSSPKLGEVSDLIEKSTGGTK